MNADKDLSVTTFACVVVPKDKLLETLKVNRDKHNALYNASVAGYWLEAQKALDQKKVEFSQAVDKLVYDFTKQKDRMIDDFTYQFTGMQALVGEQNKDKPGHPFSLNQSFSYALQFGPSWTARFPENHLEDYDRVIDLLSYSVADKVELSSNDFDAYVRNNWSWRKSFLATNAGYATSYCLNSTGFGMGLIAVSGCLGVASGSAALISGGTMNYGRYVSDTLNQAF